jgi:hypothetical protein
MKAFARMSLAGGVGLMVLAAGPSFATVLPIVDIGKRWIHNRHSHVDHLQSGRY